MIGVSLNDAFRVQYISEGSMVNPCHSNRPHSNRPNRQEDANMDPGVFYSNEWSKIPSYSTEHEMCPKYVNLHKRLVHANWRRQKKNLFAVLFSIDSFHISDFGGLIIERELMSNPMNDVVRPILTAHCLNPIFPKLLRPLNLANIAVLFIKDTFASSAEWGMVTIVDWS